MLKDLLAKGFGNDMGLCCSEKMLYGANWAYNLQLNPETLKLSAGFGGGMGIGEGGTCGALVGGVMILAHLSVKRNNHDSNIKVLNKEFADRFRAALGGVTCVELKKTQPPVQEGRACDLNKVLLTAAEIIDEIVVREGLIK